MSQRRCTGWNRILNESHNNNVSSTFIVNVNKWRPTSSWEFEFLPPILPKKLTIREDEPLSLECFVSSGPGETIVKWFKNRTGNSGGGFSFAKPQWWWWWWWWCTVSLMCFVILLCTYAGKSERNEENLISVKKNRHNTFFVPSASTNDGGTYSCVVLHLQSSQTIRQVIMVVFLCREWYSKKNGRIARYFLLV